VAEVEIIARVERRRKWTIEEKAALLAEVEAEGGKVKLVARRPRVSESLLYNWRSTTGARPGRQRRVLRSAHRDRSRSCRWACWMKRAARRRRHDRQRNRSDRTSVAKAEPGRSRSPCRTAPGSVPSRVVLEMLMTHPAQLP
jgi:transposase-like protein